jgi:hypothetical protein
VRETWFPSRERAEGERRSYRCPQVLLGHLFECRENALGSGIDAHRRDAHAAVITAFGLGELVPETGG